jgi:hypothetical protein
MSSPSMAWPVVLLVVCGLLEAGCGWLIWRRRVYRLIAGYNARRPPPHPERLACWIGVSCLVLGAVSVAGGAAITLWPLHARAAARVMAVLTVVTVGLLFVGTSLTRK